jgi:hypothetical protein
MHEYILGFIYIYHNFTQVGVDKHLTGVNENNQGRRNDVKARGSDFREIALLN